MQPGDSLHASVGRRHGWVRQVSVAGILCAAAGCSLNEETTARGYAGAPVTFSMEPTASSRSAVPPEPPPVPLALTSADLLATLTPYQRVRITGTYIHGEEGQSRYVETSFGRFRFRDLSLLIKLPPLGTMRQQVPTGQHIVVEATIMKEDLPGTNASYSIGNVVLLTTE